jgi:hypothetical protein
MSTQPVAVAGALHARDERVRRFHRWMSVVFTVGVIANFVALGIGAYPAWVGALAGVPLAVLLFTGWYLLLLPWMVARRRRGAT